MKRRNFPMPKKVELARLDADGTARPKTRLVGHVRVNKCFRGGNPPRLELEVVATGARTELLPGEGS